jgi:acyl-CoA thioester hydrolase
VTDRRAVHRIDIQIRFGDTDMFRHVNNAAFASYAELGRLTFLDDLGYPPGGLILARIELDFRQQLRFGDVAELETVVGRIGTSSLTLAQRLVSDGRVACDIGSVVVFFDYERNRSIPVPEGLRPALARYLSDPGAGG